MSNTNLLLSRCAAVAVALGLLLAWPAATSAQLAFVGVPVTVYRAPIITEVAPTLVTTPVVTTPVTTYYAPPAVETTTYYSSTAAVPVTSYYGTTAVGTTTYYAGPPVGVTTYYAPSPVVSYYAAPVRVYRPPYVVVRPKVYVPGQPVRNFWRAVTP